MTRAYLHSAERDIIHVVDDSQQTVGESGEGSAQQEDEVTLVQTHLSAKITAEYKEPVRLRITQQPRVFTAIHLPITLWAHVAKRGISGAAGGGTTPSHDEPHGAV